MTMCNEFSSKIVRVLPAAGLVFTVAVPAMARQPPAQKTLAATIEVYVFPAEGQDAAQQSKDEAECYTWATQNTGVDPFHLAKQAEAAVQQGQAAQQQVKQSGQGAGATGAVKGAAVGALIGEIASNDAGKGAAYGAAAGLLAGRSARRRGRAEASAQIERQTQQAVTATAEQTANFKKAFSVCLEAKDYLVKF